MFFQCSQYLLCASGGVDDNNNTFCDLYSYDVSIVYRNGLQAASASNENANNWTSIFNGNSLLCRAGAASVFQGQYWYIWGGKNRGILIFYGCTHLTRISKGYTSSSTSAVVFLNDLVVVDMSSNTIQSVATTGNNPPALAFSSFAIINQTIYMYGGTNDLFESVASLYSLNLSKLRNSRGG